MKDEKVKIRVETCLVDSITLQIKKEKTNALDLKVRLEKPGIGQFFKDVKGNEDIAEQYDGNAAPATPDKQFLKLAYIVDDVLRLRDKLLTETSKDNLLEYREAENMVKDGIGNLPQLLTISLADIESPKGGKIFHSVSLHNER